MPWCLVALFGRTEAATQDFTLYISSGTWPINGAGGAIVNVWGYGEEAANPTIPGPALTVHEGDAVNLTVVNNHSMDHNLVIQGVSTDLSAIPTGSSKTYSFTAPSAGTYVYSDTLNNSVNREMGLYGAFIVRPADGGNRAWTGGPAYTFERTWVVSDMDKPRWNDVAGSGGTVDTAVYKPNYFLINGLGGFDGMMDPATTIDGMVGDTALVRIVNAGQYSQSLHFHANHFEVLTSNGGRQPSPYQQLDTINVPAMTTADVLFYLNQPGHYPMHNHTSQMETANGVYLNGVGTMIMMH
jgi:FtsP/CotA-like multicopper oxidase with cupredoxin domain